MADKDIGASPCFEAVTSFRSFPEWVLFHVPHDSTIIPASIRDQFVLTDEQLSTEVIKMTDHHTFDLFAHGVPDNQIIRSPVSRLVVDVERFEDDAQEPMSARGMGVVYNLTSSGAQLRRSLSLKERQSLIEKWYQSHHELLTILTQRSIDRYGRALVIDAHSFASVPLPCDIVQENHRPEICIGTDEFHSPDSLKSSFLESFASGGFEVKWNSPFRGALVPMHFYGMDKRVSAVMVEINRGIYIDESNGVRLPDFNETSVRIRNCILDAVGKTTGST